MRFRKFCGNLTQTLRVLPHQGSLSEYLFSAAYVPSSVLSARENTEKLLKMVNTQSILQLPHDPFEEYTH